MPDTAGPVTFAEAFALARRVGSTEYRRSVVSTVRPRGVLGIARERAPLPIMLYVADREGRLIRPDAEGLILLEPPSLPPWRIPAGLGLRLLRVVDRRWDLLCMFCPPALVLLTVCAMLPFRSLWLVALLLAFSVVPYILVFQLAQLVWPIVDRLRTGPPRLDQMGARSLPAYHWTVVLCHLPDPARAQAYLRAVTGRVADLVEARLSTDAHRLRARLDRVEVFETIICLTRGITTPQAG